MRVMFLDDKNLPAFGPLALLSPPFSRGEKGFSSLALRGERSEGGEADRG